VIGPLMWSSSKPCKEVIYNLVWDFQALVDWMYGKQDTNGLLCGVNKWCSWWKGVRVVEGCAVLVHCIVNVGTPCIARVSDHPVVTV